MRNMFRRVAISVSHAAAEEELESAAPLGVAVIAAAAVRDVSPAPAAGLKA
jgi:hypothetical protein